MVIGLQLLYLADFFRNSGKGFGHKARVWRAVVRLPMQLERRRLEALRAAAFLINSKTVQPTELKGWYVTDYQVTGGRGHVLGRGVERHRQWADTGWLGKKGCRLGSRKWLKSRPCKLTKAARVLRRGQGIHGQEDG